MAPEGVDIRTWWEEHRGAVSLAVLEARHGSMPSAQSSVVINRPLGEVFDFFIDPSNESRWRTHLKEVSASGPVGSSAGPPGEGVGARVVACGSEC